MQGAVQVQGANTVYSGTYGAGTFTVIERCFASEEVGAVDVGDKFIGTYR